MKTTLSYLFLISCVLFFVPLGMAQDKPGYKYVGAKMCAMCHRTEKSGNQFGVWQKSKHCEASKVLAGPKAAEIMKAKGLTKPASESPECLGCHQTTVDTKMAETSFDPKDGTQCETCHGPGSAYKSMAVMKDKAKAIAAGMTEYRDDAAIESKCKTCHNAKSPTYKEFKFKEMWAKIVHPVPKKG